MLTRPRRAVPATLALLFALMALCAPPGAQAAPSAERVRIDVDELAPRVVDATTQTITLSGKITNTGDRRVDRIGVRLQRGNPIGDEAGLRAAIDHPQQTTAATKVSTDFKDVATTSLEPGADSRFELTVPLGADRDGLKIDKPGVYPVLLNFNGTPDFGSVERIGAVSMLLPVLAAPGGAMVAPPAAPARIGMLWPLVDERPRLAQTPIGGGKLIFSDDDLGDSLTGGRLFALVNAVEQAASADSALLRSLCFAVDPDLVSTVSAMSTGYQVRSDEGGLIEGRAKDAAKLWLSKVRALTRGQCVVALPFADADIAALTRSGSTDLRDAAIAAAATVEETLEVKPLPGVVWPAGGTLDQNTIADLAKAKPATLIADAAKLQQTAGAAPFALGKGPNRAVPYDALVASSLAPRTIVESGVQNSTLQNGVATLVFRGAFQNQPGQTVLIAPPRRWSASLPELRVFLDTFQRLHRLGYAQALNLPTLIDGASQGTAAGLDYSARDSAAEIPSPVTARIAEIDGVRRDLITNVFSTDDTVRLDPAEMLTPIQHGLLRSASATWRVRAEDASSAVETISRQLDSVLAKVTITNSDVPLALASSDAPLPLYVTNGLPLTVVARVNIGEIPGLRPENTVYVKVPANRAIIQYQRIDVTRAGLFTVNVWLTTESGTALGETSQMKLNSSSYGNITLVVTGTAAGLLVLLVGLRLFRKIRARRALAAAENDL